MPAKLSTNFQIFLYISAQTKYQSQVSARWENNTPEGSAEITHIVLNYIALKIPLKIIYALLHLHIQIFQVTIPASLKEKEVKQY